MEEYMNQQTPEEIPQPQKMDKANKKLNIILTIGLGCWLVGMILSNMGGALEAIGLILELISIPVNIAGVVIQLKNRGHVSKKK